VVNVKQWRLSYNQLFEISVRSLRAKKLHLSAFVQGVYFAIAFARLSDGKLYYCGFSVSKRTAVGLEIVLSIMCCLLLRSENLNYTVTITLVHMPILLVMKLKYFQEEKEWPSL
jgi:hypothetical protein